MIRAVERVTIAMIPVALGIAACGRGDTAGSGATPASITARVTPPKTAAAGMPVTPAPAVVVRNRSGSPLPNASVTFSVVEGGGTVANAHATTDSNGVVAAQWTLGRQVGENQLRAAIAGAAPVDFQVRAVAGPPSQMYTIGGRPSTDGRHPLDIGVVVIDQFDNPIPSLLVTFEPLGGTTVRPTRAVTSSFGVASAMWNVATTPGEARLRATAASLEPLIFVATVVPPAKPCTAAGTVDVSGTPITGELRDGDCVSLARKRLDAYAIHAQAQTAFDVKLSSSAFDPVVSIYGSDINSIGDPLASNDDLGQNDKDAGLTVIASTGDYLISAEEFEPRSGPYTLTVSAAPADIPGCADVFAVPDVTIEATLAPGDCADGDAFADEVKVYVRQGERLDVTMTSAAFDAKLDLEGEIANNEFEISDDNSGGGTNARITITAPVSDIYEIRATSVQAKKTGPYTLTITRPGPESPAGVGGGPIATLFHLWGARGVPLWETLHPR